MAIIATAGLLVWISWGQPNLFGLWTFLLLWASHVSAKLNVFFGVRNLNIEFIPDRLSYLASFFRQRPMNLLFPFSVTAGTIVTTMLVQEAAYAATASSFSTAGYVLLATLMALAVIEHWFMILPIPAEALWRWSLKPPSSNSRNRTIDPVSAAARPPGPETAKSLDSFAGRQDSHKSSTRSARARSL